MLSVKWILNDGSICICIYFNKYIWIHFMITYNKMHFKRRFQIQELQGVCTACTRRPQRANGALEDATVLPQRPHCELSNTLCKRQAAACVFSIFKINAAAWRSRRLNSVFTAFPLWRRCEDAALVWQCFYISHLPVTAYTQLPYSVQTTSMLLVLRASCRSALTARTQGSHGL